jgi:glycosyltransferase involved in cell wall biosynthesis
MKETKKIMIVTPYFPPKIGGVENYAYNIAQGLREKFGWDIVIVTSSNNKQVQNHDIEGLKVYTLPALFTFSNTPINPFWYFQLKEIIKKERPGLINAHSPVPFLSDMAALAAGKIPFILTYHAPSMKKGSLLLDLIIRSYEHFGLNRLKNKSSKIICCSEFVRRTMFNNNSKSLVISPAVDLKVFKPDPKVKKELNTILFIARHSKLYKIKGLYSLTEAIKPLPGVKLKVIGEKRSLKNPQITFLGIMTHPEIYKEMQKAAVLALPSSSNTEGFGMVLIEAMACKTAVIGTNGGGIPEIISDGKDGFLVPPNNVKALREAIQKVVGHKKLITQMGENGYQKVKQKFIWEEKVSETEKVMSQFL